MACILVVAVVAQRGAQGQDTAAPPHRYNTVLGTTTIGAIYQFTSLSLVEETGLRIAAMGSAAVKIYASGSSRVIKNNDGWESVLSMPFAHVYLWYRTAAEAWFHGLSAADAVVEYELTYNFTRDLLTNFSGTGRSFYLGQWEVDWEALGTVNGSHNRQSRGRPAQSAGPH